MDGGAEEEGSDLEVAKMELEKWKVSSHIMSTADCFLNKTVQVPDDRVHLKCFI